MIITHNMTAMTEWRLLGLNDQTKVKAMERMSSGYKLVNAADNAAGMGISEKWRGQIRGLNRGSVNVEEGISMTQVADGALHEVQSILQRMRELGVQSSNDVYCAADREKIDEEIQQLKEETNRIFRDTEYNTIHIFHTPYTPEVEMVPFEKIPQTRELIELNSNFPPGAVMDTDSWNAKHMIGTYTASNGTVYHAASRIDFSGVDFSDLSKLSNTGFYSTCCTCTDKYCITFDATKSTHSVEGRRNYTFTVGIQNCSTAAELVQAIVDATGGKPNNHYTYYAVDPNDKNKLLIYDERPNQTANGGSGMIGTGVVKEAIINPVSPAFMLFNKDFQDGSGKSATLYGGIEANDVRHTWDELGIEISNDGTKFKKDQTVTFHDYNGELFILNTFAGKSVDSITRTNLWSADQKGVYINDVFARTWQEIGIKEKDNHGSHDILYRDMKITLTVNDGDSLEDIIAGINGEAFDRVSWDILPSRHVISTALEIKDGSAVSMTNANKKWLDDNVTYSIDADDDYVWIVSDDGSGPTIHTKMKWDDFKNVDDTIVTPDGTGYKQLDYPVIDWGVDDKDGKGLDSDLITFDDSAKYQYTDSFIPDTPISFAYTLADEAGLPEAIEALKGAVLSKRYNAPGTAEFEIDSNKISDGSISITNNRMKEYELQKAYGRNLDNKNQTWTGEIDRTFTYTRNPVQSGSRVYGNQNLQSLTEISRGTAKKVYIQNAAGTYDVYDEVEVKGTANWVRDDTINERFAGYFTYSGKFNGEDFTDTDGNTSQQGQTLSYNSVTTKTMKATQNATWYEYTQTGTVTSLTGSETVISGKKGTAYTGNISNFTEASSKRVTTPSQYGAKDQIEIKTSKYGDAAFSVSFDLAKTEKKSDTVDFAYKSTGYVQCIFEGQAGDLAHNEYNINDSTRFEDVRVNPPEKHFWIQAGANTRHGIDLMWHGMNNSVIGIGGAKALTRASSQKLIRSADKAMAYVSSERSRWGTHQNRLEHAKAYDDNAAENAQATESKIRDADMAEEAVALARSTILEQAGMAMLAQTQNVGEGVLRLLN